MRMLLVKLPEPYRPTQKPCYMPPIGLWSIAHNAKRWHNAYVTVIDCHLDDDPALLTAMRGCGWDMIGLSVQFSIQHEVYARAAAVCGTEGAEVVAGGFHASAVPAPPGIDRVIKGGGETGLYPAMSFGDIDYPPPDADLMKPYWEKGSPHDLQSRTGRWMPVEFSRGCNRRCGYCGVNGFWGGTRYFSRAKISAYLDALVTEGFQEVFIEDDNFLADGDNFSWIINELGRRGIFWSTPNGIYAKGVRAHIRELARSGCWRVSLPFETGTESTARLMHLGNKWMPQAEALELLEMVKAEGILTCGFFIIGYPGESLDDMRITLEYANSLPLDQRNISIATPYPGSELYNICTEKGYLETLPPKLYDDLLFTKAMISTPEFKPWQVDGLKSRDRREAIERRQNDNHA